MEEHWRDIPGYEGLYQVSNYGNVKSTRFNKERLLKPGKSKTCYLCVALFFGKSRKTQYVHRLVWIAFNGPAPSGMQVNHMNEVKTDNRLENLNLLSIQGNLTWGTAQERKRQTWSKRGRTKEIVQYDLNGNKIQEWVSINEAQRALKVFHISHCLHNLRKTSGGFIWKYK